MYSQCRISKVVCKESCYVLQRRIKVKTLFKVSLMLDSCPHIFDGEPLSLSIDWQDLCTALQELTVPQKA